MNELEELRQFKEYTIYRYKKSVSVINRLFLMKGPMTKEDAYSALRDWSFNNPDELIGKFAVLLREVHDSYEKVMAENYDLKNKNQELRNALKKKEKK